MTAQPVTRYAPPRFEEVLAYCERRRAGCLAEAEKLKSSPDRWEERRQHIIRADAYKLAMDILGEVLS